MFVKTGNMDPRVFDGSRFDITADRPPQLTFGGGIHYCLGATLGRAEQAEAVPILAQRLRQPRLAGSPNGAQPWASPAQSPCR